MRLVLHVWRQADAQSKGRFEQYVADEASEEMSLLELLDVVNEGLCAKGEAPIAFEHDCREGICGACSLVVNGRPHGPQQRATSCQLHLRHFHDGEEIWLEPFRARAFPVLRDLVVDRSALDRVIRAGGYVSVGAGSAPEANSVAVPKQRAERAMDAAACIGCGACVAACPNASAMLFAASKLGHLGLLPQGQPEAEDRVRTMVAQMDAEGFGGCTNHLECEAVCPKGISAEHIAKMNRDFAKAMLFARHKLPRRS
jgi:succinate dehydrogenase / fumarate reductase, iron-sulfur subunit